MTQTLAIGDSKMNEQKESQECQACNGLGVVNKVICLSCFGTGEIITMECPVCYGDGAMGENEACWLCESTGEVTEKVAVDYYQ